MTDCEEGFIVNPVQGAYQRVPRLVDWELGTVGAQSGSMSFENRLPREIKRGFEVVDCISRDKRNVIRRVGTRSAKNPSGAGAAPFGSKGADFLLQFFTQRVPWAMRRSLLHDPQC